MCKTKVALVTGASKGIGASIALRLADDGYAIAVNYSRDVKAAESLVTKLIDNGVKAISVKCDVANATEVEIMFTAIESRLGKLDILVNNAGIMKLALIADSSEQLFDSQIETNLKGTFNTLRQASKRLADGGRIINISTSVLGLRLETYGVYAATKAAVESLTATLSKELRGRSITVNAVAPGPTATELFFSNKPPELIERMSKMSPLERLGSPEDIAHAVSFLASEEGGWINGQVLRANGGVI
ncbi:SDR family oxidoreductase [Paraglaciecola sp. 2405UD69-4]|uniref:SDR family oxidoreductase n=1 Tax=Paraglaciecola sp. 2405UD69-4 TaxID=3391836 RepID=UPI0039C8F1CF